MRASATIICGLFGVLVLAAGCSGDGGTAASSTGRETSSAADDVSLARAGFKEAVASGLEQAGFEAEQGFGLKVHAEQGENWIDVVLGEPFAEYREDESRREELVARVVSETRERFRTGISELSFEDVGRSLMPLLKPRFELRTFPEAPPSTSSVGGLSVIYAVERDNAFTIVSEADIRRWGRPLSELHELALDNLLRRTNREEKLLCEPSGDGEQLCGWASGDGYDAARMIVPGLRRQIREEYGEPAVYAVPMENVFVALPLRLAGRKSTETLLRTKVQRDFQTADKPVSPELFVERDGKLVVFAS